MGDALWNLHQLDILDKHTLLVPAVCSLQEITPRLIALPPFGDRKVVQMQIGHVKKFPLEDGDVLASYPATQPEASVDVQATINIVFGQGQIVDGEPVSPMLGQFGQLVEKIVGSFASRRDDP